MEINFDLIHPNPIRDVSNDFKIVTICILVFKQYFILCHL